MNLQREPAPEASGRVAGEGHLDALMDRIKTLWADWRRMVERYRSGDGGPKGRG